MNETTPDLIDHLLKNTRRSLDTGNRKRAYGFMAHAFYLFRKMGKPLSDEARELYFSLLCADCSEAVRREQAAA